MTAPRRSSTFQVLPASSTMAFAAAAEHDRFERGAGAERWIEEEHPENFAREVAAMRLALPSVRGGEDAVHVFEPERSDGGGVFHSLGETMHLLGESGDGGVADD